MLIKCISRVPTPQQVAELGADYFRDQAFHIRVGATYTVLGLTFYVGSKVYGTCTTVEIADDYGHLATVPVCLFQIVDDRASRHWNVRVWEDGTVALWPRSFFAEFYHDDLAEGVPDVVDDYKRVKRQIEAEAAEPVLRVI